MPLEVTAVQEVEESMVGLDLVGQVPAVLAAEPAPFMSGRGSIKPSSWTMGASNESSRSSIHGRHIRFVVLKGGLPQQAFHYAPV
mmetsp:Transcript_38754/g.102504  ORF Transcript_38754/g.102504 Transcript_38754/m.102504 type:complete len:85 (+) Transcript_38754:117-371(+)